MDSKSSSSPSDQLMELNVVSSQEDNRSLTYLNDHPEFLSPTSLQQAAVNALQSFGIPRVLAWLEIMRSLEPEYHYLYHAGCLDRLQLEALSTLTTCHEDRVAAWLQLSSQQTQFDPPAVAQPSCGVNQSLAAIRHGDTQKNTFMFMHGPAAGTTTSPSPNTQLTRQVTPRTSWSEAKSSGGWFVQPSTLQDITNPSGQPTLGFSPHQALLPSPHNNKHRVGLSSAPSLSDTAVENLRSPLQSSLTELSPFTSQDYLMGIGAWQAGPTQGFINRPSAASADGKTNDLEPQAYYPELSDEQIVLDPLAPCDGFVTADN